jgi:tetratricopeptide (TPR) repeat protein
LLDKIGRHQDAIDELNRGLGFNKDEYRLLCNMGFQLNKIGKQRQAKDILLTAIKMNPKDAFSWNNLGISHYDLGDLKEALKCFNTAVELIPDYKDAHFNRIKVLRWMFSLKRQKQVTHYTNAFYLTGTCGICKNRFRFHALDVVNNDKIFCFKCGSQLEESELKLIAWSILDAAGASSPSL